MREQQTPFVLLSAERPNWSDEVNKGRTEFLRHQLIARKAEFLRVDGNYKGRAEASFLVLTPNGTDDAQFTNAVQLARRYGQESILYVASDRSAYLIEIAGPEFPQGREVTYVGNWSEIADGAKEQLDAYTESPDGRIWATV